MALAPTLLTFLNIAPITAAAAISGPTPSFPIVYALPATAGLSVNVLAPTVSVLEGPVTEALQPAIAYAGGSLEPFLLRELIVYPSLPDATPEENDLSVTVIWGGAAQPGVGAVTMTGIAPILTFNAGEALAKPTLGSVTVAGLAPRTPAVPERLARLSGLEPLTLRPESNFTNGYGKRTELGEYRLQSRGGKGLINIKTSERNGPVVGVNFLRADEQVMLITEKGMIIRLNTADISTIGRNTQGVRLIQLEEGDHLVSVARLAEREEDEESPGDPAGPGASKEEP